MLPAPDLTGTWQSNFQSPAAQMHVREYLTRGRQLQEQWCGFAWPASEIDRRLSVISRGRLKWEIEKTAGGRAYWRTTSNESGRSKRDLLAYCENRPDAILKCKILCPSEDAACRPGDLFLRVEARRLYLLTPMRKSEMQCEGANVPPDQTEWTSPAFLESTR